MNTVQEQQEFLWWNKKIELLFMKKLQTFFIVVIAIIGACEKIEPAHVPDDASTSGNL